jgi:aconitate hydratase
LRFNIVGYLVVQRGTSADSQARCPKLISKTVQDKGLVVAAVLSGNRDFEGRVHADVRANYLAPPLVADALAGRVDPHLATEPLGAGSDGKPAYLRDIWPTQQEIRETVEKSVRQEYVRRGL